MASYNVFPSCWSTYLEMLELKISSECSLTFFWVCVLCYSTRQYTNGLQISLTNRLNFKRLSPSLLSFTTKNTYVGNFNSQVTALNFPLLWVIFRYWRDSTSQRFPMDECLPRVGHGSADKSKTRHVWRWETAQTRKNVPYLFIIPHLT